jgi:hypothetical protein
MAPRRSIKTNADGMIELRETAESPAEPMGQRKRPDKGQYRLQVDRQTKGSYETLEAAEAAGRVIKTAYPIVHVTVYDIVEGQNRVIEVPTP